MQSVCNTRSGVVYFLVSLDGVHLNFTFTTWWTHVSWALLLYIIHLLHIDCKLHSALYCEVGNLYVVIRKDFHTRRPCLVCKFFNELPLRGQILLYRVIEDKQNQFFLCYSTWHDSWYSVSYIRPNTHPSSIMLMTRCETLLTYPQRSWYVTFSDRVISNPWSDLWVMFCITISNPGSLGIYMSGI